MERSRHSPAPSIPVTSLMSISTGLPETSAQRQAFSVSATQAPASLPARCKRHSVPSSSTVILNISVCRYVARQGHVDGPKFREQQSIENQRLNCSVRTPTAAFQYLFPSIVPTIGHYATFDAMSQKSAESPTVAFPSNPVSGCDNCS
jgi:hypothetical protein